MQRESDRSNIPLITMPWEVNFLDITQSLLTRIVREQHRLLEDAESINRSLLLIAVNRGTLETLCTRVGELTGLCSAVVDPGFKVITRGGGGFCDPAFPQIFLKHSGAVAATLRVESLETPTGHGSATR